MYKKKKQWVVVFVRESWCSFNRKESFRFFPSDSESQWLLSESLRVHHALTGILLHLHVTRLIHVYAAGFLWTGEIYGHLSGKGAKGPKITLTKEKKGKNKKSEEKEKGRRENKDCTFDFING